MKNILQIEKVEMATITRQHSMTSFPSDKQDIIKKQGGEIQVIGWSGYRYVNDVNLYDGGEKFLVANTERVKHMEIYIDKEATEKIITDLRTEGSSVYRYSSTVTDKQEEIIFFIPDTVDPSKFENYKLAYPPDAWTKFEKYKQAHPADTST